MALMDVELPRAGTFTMGAEITSATKALLRTRNVKVRLAATMVSPSGSRTTSYKIITLRGAAPLPVVG